MKMILSCCTCGFLQALTHECSHERKMGWLFFPFALIIRKAIEASETWNTPSNLDFPFFYMGTWNEPCEIRPKFTLLQHSLSQYQTGASRNSQGRYADSPLLLPRVWYSEIYCDCTWRHRFTPKAKNSCKICACQICYIILKLSVRTAIWKNKYKDMYTSEAAYRWTYLPALIRFRENCAFVYNPE